MVTKKHGVQNQPTCLPIYSVDRVDVAQEIEKRAKWAAQASAARSANRSMSSAISTLSPLYQVRPQDGQQEMQRN